MVSTQAIDNEEQKLNTPAGKKTARKKLFYIRATFVFAWLCFSAVIFLIALLTDINWMRPTLEQLMSQSVHRNVKLGRLSWLYGWRGLSIDTSSMLISDRSGEPFIMARRCQIGFTLGSLVLDRGQIAFVNIQSPLFMAVHLAPKKWNFDDLMVASPDIDSIQIEDGHVFVVDRQLDKSQNIFPDTELNNLDIKLQRAGNFSPAQVNVAFALSENKAKALYSFGAKIWGTENKPWWEKKCHFEVNTKRFTSDNWKTISSVLEGDNQDFSKINPLCKMISGVPKSIFGASSSTKIFLPTAGQFDLHATSDGIPSAKLKADLQLEADNLVISATNKQVNLPQTQIKAQLEAGQNSISWKNAIVKIPAYDLQLNSFGNTAIANDGQQTYNWDIIGLLPDLTKLNPLASFVYSNILSGTTSSARTPLGNLDGKLFFDLRLDKNNEKTDYVTEVKAVDINIDSSKSLLLCINQLVNNKPMADNPFGKQCFEKLKLSKQAQFTGKISAKSGQGLTLTDCYLADDQMTWKLSGQADESGNWRELIVANKDLQLSKLSDKINHDQDWARQIKGFLGLANNCQIDLKGKAQIELAIKSKTANPELDTRNDNNTFNCATIFDDVELKTSEPNLDIDHLFGAYEVSPRLLVCKRLHFAFANHNNSAVEINARLPNDKNEPLEYQLSGKNVDVPELFAVLKLFHLDPKWLDAWHLDGKLAEIKLSITGTPKSPMVAFTIMPQDLVFTAPNLKPLIHAKGGEFGYANDVFSCEKVDLTTQNSRCLTSLRLHNSGSGDKLEKLHLQIEGADLADLQNFSLISSPSASPASASSSANSSDSSCFSSGYSNLLKKYQISNLKGNLIGVIDYNAKKEKGAFSGLVDFDSLGFKCGQQRLRFQNLKGRANFSDTDFYLRNVNGSIEDAVFTLNGRIANYKDKSSQWHGEFDSQVTPDQLNNILALCSTPGQKFPLNLQGKKAVSIKLKSGFHNNVCWQSFALVADQDAALIATMGNFNFSQPAKRLVINGSCVIDEQKLTWRNLNFDLGGNSINVQGVINNFRNTRNNKLEPIYDLQLQTSDYVPANLVGQVISCGVIDGALTGQIKFMLGLQGTAKALSINGKVFLLDLTWPQLYLNHIVGTILFQPPKPGDINNATALLQLDKISFGDILLSQASGNLIWQGDTSASPQINNDWSQIYLKNFIARIAQGQFTAQGHADLKARSVSLDMDVSDANLAQLWPQISNSQIKAIGLLNSHVSMQTKGGTTREFEQNMTGSGKVHIGEGSFSRLSVIHARLNQANLLRQGIFGFNFNNVMQSVLPAKASEFKSIDSAFNLDNEVLTVRHVLYDGKDIKFSAAGKANLALHNLDMDIAGVMPRVSNSILGGKLGELSREITLQKLLDGMTMHKLEKLPTLPLIGGMAGGPEVFTCHILAPYDQPKLISQSIQKSFRWLHGH